MPKLRARLDSTPADFAGDGDDALEWLDDLYSTPLKVRGRVGGVTHRRQSGDGLALDHLTIGASITFDVEVLPVLVVVDVLHGEVEYTHDAVTDRGRDGDTVLASGWERPFTGSGHSYGVRNTSVTADLLDAAVREIAPDKSGEDLVFSGFVPRSRAAAARWRATLDQLAASFPRPDDEIGHAHAARLVGHTLLHTFANNVVGSASEAEDARDRRDASQAVLRRAQDAIESRAQDDLSQADLAQACGVTPRAVQYAFRRHLGCTPSDYLKQVRLDLVHQTFCDGTADSVADAAARYGFFNPGRFAADYRRVFNENPRETLTRHHTP